MPGLKPAGGHPHDAHGPAAGAAHGHHGKLSGGHWVTVRGHPIYIKGGKVVAGGIPGVTHDAATGHPLHGPKVNHAHMAAGVAKGEAAAAAAQKIPNPHNWKYEHGEPHTPADTKHLERATAKGKVAVVVHDRPIHEAIPDHALEGRALHGSRLDASSTSDRSVFRKPDATHHLVENEHTAAAWSENGKHFSYGGGAEVRHKTREGAEERATREARRVVRESSETARLSVEDPAKFEPFDHANAHPHRTTTFRVIKPPTDFPDHGDQADHASARADRPHKGHSLGDSRGSILEPPARTHTQAARDTFSRAKIAHKDARAAHKAGPTADTAAHLHAAREALGHAREGYRAASGGTIHPHPLDSMDPRIKALRHDRNSANPHAKHSDGIIRELSDKQTPRERRENAVLIRTPSPHPVVHHYGEDTPPIPKADAAITRKAAVQHEANRKPLSDDQAIHAARYADQQASYFSGGSRGGHSYLIYDRLNGQHHYDTDFGFDVSKRRHKSVLSGRSEVVKAYHRSGPAEKPREVPVTREMIAGFRRFDPPAKRG